MIRAGEKFESFRSDIGREGMPSFPFSQWVQSTGQRYLACLEVPGRIHLLQNRMVL